MGKLSRTSLESSNTPLISVRQKQWPTVLDTTLPATALCSVPAVAGSCSPCAQDGKASHGVLSASPGHCRQPQ